MKAIFKSVPVPKERLVAVELTPEEALAVCNLIGYTSDRERIKTGLSKRDNDILVDLFHGRDYRGDGLSDVLKRGGLK